MLNNSGESVPNCKAGDQTKSCCKMPNSSVSVSDHSHMNHDEPESNYVERLFLVSALLTLPYFIHMLGLLPAMHNGYIQLYLTTPVFIISLLYFGKSALASLKHKSPNMDCLIIIGVISAYLYSLYSLLANLGDNFLFFETASTVTTLVLLGNVIEHRAIAKTTSALKDLASLKPQEAKLLSSGDLLLSEYKIINSSEIKLDDLLQVNSGDNIPTDGEIVWGNGSFNESMITGESLSVSKSVGDQTVGGTILVDGNIKIRATAIGANTVLSNIIGLVESAQNKKPKIQKLGDKISTIFVPTVFVISILTFIVTYFLLKLGLQTSMLRALAVVVVSCPCAMGLATPTAVVVGLGRAAKRGILIKGGDTSERLSKVKTVIFDKTGTLTDGKLKVSKIITFNNSQEAEIRSIVKTLERYSNHPIAKSLLEAFKLDSDINIVSTREQAGVGVYGDSSDGDKYFVGSWRGIKEIDNNFKDLNYSIYIAKNFSVIGALELNDSLATNAIETINALHKIGIKTAMLSGDKLEKCKEVAAQLGIIEVFAEKTPQEKLQIIESYKSKNETAKNGVAFVGDGINDAPALTMADVGISFGNASEISIKASDVVLLSHDLGKIIESFGIGKATYKTIVQNLFWAFFYNIFAIPLASMGGLTPTLGAITMACSDVVIIGNSLLLKFKNIVGTNADRTI